MNATHFVALLGAAFVLTHLLQAHLPLRQLQIDRIGRSGYLVLYSVVSLALYIPLVVLWWKHRNDGAAVWGLPATWGAQVAEVIAACGLGLLGAGAVSPVPASLTTAHRPIPVQIRGAASITRHPVAMGLVLLSTAHLLQGPHLAGVFFWGAHLVISIAGAWHQDSRHKTLRPQYGNFMAATSFFPNPIGALHLGAKAGAGLFVGVAAAVAIRFAHSWF